MNDSQRKILLSIRDLAEARLRDDRVTDANVQHDLREIVRLAGVMGTPTDSRESVPPVLQVLDLPSAPTPTNWEARTTLSGMDPDSEEHKAIDPSTGMQRDYVVLSDAERAKGFVRPVRRSYVHVGAPAPTGTMRDLTPEELESGKPYGYVKFEDYPESRRPLLGRSWTQKDLDRVGTGCGATTTMGQELAETYAREPRFYGATFCATCKEHFPVGEQGEFVWADTTGRVGT